MPMVTITNNLGENIPIRDYAANVYNDREWGGDAEISMIPLVFQDITVVTYKMEKHELNDIILGYRFIQIYGNINDPNTSILILININDNHWNTAFIIQILIYQNQIIIFQVLLCMMLNHVLLRMMI